MPVLVFRHSPTEPLGRIADSLDARAIEWRYVDLWASPDGDLAVDHAQALISLGGAMSVNDPLPWLRQEERYLARAIGAGVPVLGVCLGAQLLARCMGARVYRMDRKEIGWYPVRFTGLGRRDPLFERLPQPETFFHWHGETFDLPIGAERLAQSNLCANQAFRYGSNVYGVQFHPEVTPEIISTWCDQDSTCGKPSEAGPIDAFARTGHMRDVASHIFGRWCNLVATR